MRFFFYGLALIASLSLVPTVAVADSAGDKAMAQNIADSFKSSGQMQKYHVGVKCDNGTAWLVGSVTDADQQQTAIRIAQAAPGVTRVINKLVIENGQVARATIDAVRTRNQLRTQNQAGSRDLQQPQGMSVQASLAEPTDSGPSFEISTPIANERFAPVVEDESFTRQPRIARRPNRPLALARRSGAATAVGGRPMPAHAPIPSGVAPARYDQPQMPGYAWPSYAAYPNYAGLTYPKQYSPTAWPFIGPFYPYPQVPLGWRKVTLEWDDGWWQLDFQE
jgi:hypothetical protein